jgi:hypothetical protein
MHEACGNCIWTGRAAQCEFNEAQDKKTDKEIAVQDAKDAEKLARKKRVVKWAGGNPDTVTLSDSEEDEDDE